MNDETIKSPLLRYMSCLKISNHTKNTYSLAVNILYELSNFNIKIIQYPP